jgi:hypothetical protein
LVGIRFPFNVERMLHIKNIFKNIPTTVKKKKGRKGERGEGGINRMLIRRGKVVNSRAERAYGMKSINTRK